MDTTESEAVVQMDEVTILMLENDLVETNSAKLYLNVKTSDVCFVFESEQGDGIAGETHRVYAHKAILAAGSDVFDAMFFGQLKENGEIKIVDASADAFEEFLQFFYRTKMQLTMENLGDVVNLCRKYQVDDALKACEDRIKESLNVADICWGYIFARNRELNELRVFCQERVLIRITV